jgi:pimeloyl-ACP methyl ester carboxylesterase
MLARDPLPQATTPPVPTLLLWGAEDKLATLDEAEKIKASIAGSTLSPIADCGHLPQLEATEVFVWQVLQFLDVLSRPPKVQSKGVGMLGQKK